MRNLFKALIIFLLAIVIVLSLGYMVQKSPWYRRKLYPLRYEKYIIKYSEEFSLDPYLVSAVIWAESRFVPNATSIKNARGLMQITPETGKWGAELLNIEGFEVDDLYDIDLNIRLGCWYLDKLNIQFDGNIELVLAAYNGGSGNVSRWLKDTRYSKDGKTLYYIPFKRRGNMCLKLLPLMKSIKLYDLR